MYPFVVSRSAMNTFMPEGFSFYFAVTQRSYEALLKPSKMSWSPWGFLNIFKPLSANPTKCSKTLKQVDGCCRRIVWVCLTILCGWCLKGYTIARSLGNIFFNTDIMSVEAMQSDKAAEVVAWRCSWKKKSLTVLQNFQGNTFARSLFLIMLQA